MQLYLNLPLKAGMVLVLTDSTNTYRQLPVTKHRFFPNEPVEVPDKIGNRFLKEKKRKQQDGTEVGFLSNTPYAGEWPATDQVPTRMPKRRTRAGQLRPQGDPGTHVGRRLPGNMQRKNSQLETEIESDVAGGHLQESDATAYVDKLLKKSDATDSTLKDDGDERFTRIVRDDRLAGLKLRALASKDFKELKPGPIGLAVKTLGFKLTDKLELSVRQAALETMCEIVSKEVEIAK